MYKIRESPILVNLSNNSLLLHLPGKKVRLSSGGYIDLDYFPEFKKRQLQINKQLSAFERAGTITFLSTIREAEELDFKPFLKKENKSNKSNSGDKDFDLRMDNLIKEADEENEKVLVPQIKTSSNTSAVEEDEKNNDESEDDGKDKEEVAEESNIANPWSEV